MRAESVQTPPSQTVPAVQDISDTQNHVTQDHVTHDHDIQDRPAETTARVGPSWPQLKGADLGSCMESLRRRATRLTGNTTDADDLVQETLKRALTYMDGRRDIANPLAYLFAMLHHAHYDFLRQRPARDTVSIEDAILVSPPNQHDRLECREMFIALGELPKEQRQVLLLIGLEGHSYKDAAACLEIPIGTVMSRLSRGRERLSNLMEKNAPEAQPAHSLN